MPYFRILLAISLSLIAILAVRAVETSDKHQKAVLDFVKGIALLPQPDDPTVIEACKAAGGSVVVKDGKTYCYKPGASTGTR